MATVTVSSKIPLDLIIEHKGKSVTLNGSNKSLIPEYGVGSTEVEKTFAEAWFEANKHQPYVANGVVFYSKNQDVAKGEAKEKIDLKSGTERLEKSTLDKIQAEKDKAVQ